MLSNISVVALLLQSAMWQPSPTSLQQPSLAASSGSTENLTDAAGYAVLRFLTTWRTAWMESVGARGYGNTILRLRDVHCHWDGSYSATAQHLPPPSLIHRGSRRSMCPDWLPTDEREADERSDRDVALTGPWRGRVRSARSFLIDTLAMYASRKPDNWIEGQRVRFLIDQGEMDAAVHAASECKSDKVWCSELAGYALHAAGDYRRADSAFDAAAAAMEPRKRCEWTSARSVLDRDSRGAYEDVKCDQRAATDERLWWVSAPLLSDSVSDRRSEHFARKVMIELHGALPWDERYDWRGQYGGEAVSEMLVRYGWPSFSAFAGRSEEMDHAGWMSFYDSTRTATAEYPQDRLHLIPNWRAVADPFHAKADAWQINMPKLNYDDEPAAQWWPSEHYARDRGGILQLSEQTVMFRRDTNVVIATASELRPEIRTLSEDSSRTVFVRSTGPRQTERVAHREFRNDNAIVVEAVVPASPALVGTELVAPKRGDLSARTRFGIVPPAPLKAFGPGERAISDPVLLVPDDMAPSTPEAALRRMMGSTRVRGGKMGVYWETYGYEDGDSVEVSVVIARHEQISKIRRLGMLLRVAHDINGQVAVRWTEPQTGRESWAIPGVVPIRARSIQLDLSRIEPGHYSVDILIGKRGGIPVRSSRDFVFEGM